MTLELVPVDRATAYGFIAAHHRHHRPPAGYKYAVGAAVDGELVAVAVIGRPVARHLDDGRTLEVTRTCTNGTANANSFLYGAAWRAAKALGYRRLVTYTQSGETGASLRGAGWRIIAERRARPSGWDTPTRRRSSPYDAVSRTLWEATP